MLNTTAVFLKWRPPPNDTINGECLGRKRLFFIAASFRGKCIQILSHLLFRRPSDLILRYFISCASIHPSTRRRPAELPDRGPRIRFGQRKFVARPHEYDSGLAHPVHYAGQPNGGHQVLGERHGGNCSGLWTVQHARFAAAGSAHKNAGPLVHQVSHSSCLSVRGIKCTDSISEQQQQQNSVDASLTPLPPPFVQVPHQSQPLR